MSDSGYQIIGIAREEEWNDMFWYISVIQSNGGGQLRLLKVDLSTMTTKASYGLYYSDYTWMHYGRIENSATKTFVYFGLDRIQIFDESFSSKVRFNLSN